MIRFVRLVAVCIESFNILIYVLVFILILETLLATPKLAKVSCHLSLSLSHIMNMSTYSNNQPCFETPSDFLI